MSDRSFAACFDRNEASLRTPRREPTCLLRLCAAGDARTIHSSVLARHDETHAASSDPVRWSRTTSYQSARHAARATRAIQSSKNLRLPALSLVQRRSRLLPPPESFRIFAAKSLATHCRNTPAREHQSICSIRRQARAGEPSPESLL